MNKFLLTLAALIFVSNCTCSQFTLKIKITGLMNKAGKIILQVFDLNEDKTIVLKTVY